MGKQEADNPGVKDVCLDGRACDSNNLDGWHESAVAKLAETGIAANPVSVSPVGDWERLPLSCPNSVLGVLPDNPDNKKATFFPLCLLWVLNQMKK